jgi:thiamine biosynthesis lipoprotein
LVDVASKTTSEDAMQIGITQVREFIKDVDLKFSPYDPDSFVTLLRTGQMDRADAPEIVQSVWHKCEQVRDLTNGAFDPWAVKGGFDPSGLVKGWAADICADMLVKVGCEHVQINAAGDLALRGGFLDIGTGEVKPWNIGVINPDAKMETLKSFEITNGAIATSGDYEKGAHIIDPRISLPAIGARSATVIGPDGAIADALATACMVDGKESNQWIGAPELAEYSFFVLNRHEKTAWGYGPLAD